MYARSHSRFATRFALVGLAGLFLAPAARAQEYAGKGALLGGLAGAGAGAIIGNQNKHQTGAGAAIGAGVGALSGLLIGKTMENEVQKNRAQATAQTAAAYEQRALQVRAGGVTPEDVIAMTRAGLSEDVINGQIRTSGINRQMQVNDLIYLRNQGVPDGVIRTLQSSQVASAGSVNYTPSSYQQAYQAPTTVIAPAPPPVVVVEPVPVYRPYPYYCPPHHYYHHHHGHYHRPPGVSWGISFSGH